MGGKFGMHIRALHNGASTEQVLSWLFSREVYSLDLPEFVETLGLELRRAGIGVDRILTGAITAHPQVAIIGVEWRPERGVVVFPVTNEAAREDRVSGSPFAALRAGLDEISTSLDIDPAALPYDKLRVLKDEGYTYYFARALPLGQYDAHAIAFCSRSKGGFGPDQLETLRFVCLAMAGRLEAISLRHTLTSLLRVYLGQDAASRVLAGAFERGSGTEIDAAIWFCDLRGFTQLSDTVDARSVVSLLDQVFERVGLAVAERGGTILKFIGDAVLAIFPCGGEGARDACTNALEASKDAVEELAIYNGHRQMRGEEPVQLGIALHRGSVYYGNIGAAERLDFTVIGAAVNEVCRLEGLCKEVGRDILMTDAFARALEGDWLESLGPHRFKGVGRDVEVFGLSKR